MNRLGLLVGVVGLGALPSVLTGQTRLVVGVVREAGTGLPVANSEIRIVGQEVGVCTNPSGEYRVQAPVGSVRLTAWYRGVLSGLKTLAGSDNFADFEVDLGPESVGAPNQPLFYIDGKRVYEPPPQQSGPREILLIDGIEISNRPDRCQSQAPSRQGPGDGGAGAY